jgi:hypothetical protein
VPLTLEGPTWTMRGVPAGGCDLSHGDWRSLGASVTAWSCSCGAVSGRDSGDRLRPVPGQPSAAARRAVGLPPEGRDESCRSATAGPRRPLPLITGPPAALLSPGCSRQLALPVPAVGVARRRCALEAAEKVVTGQVAQVLRRLALGHWGVLSRLNPLTLASPDA